MRERNQRLVAANMPTASEGIHRVRGNGWQPFATQKCAARALPVHVDLSGRRTVHGVARTTKVAPPPAFRQPKPPAATVSWQTMLRHLKDFSVREGHTNIPLGYEFVERDERGYEVDGHRIRLGVWLSKQWSDWQAKRLSHDRTVQLRSAGVNWEGSAPPANGLVGPQHLNERKWDSDRSARLAAEHLRRPFDASKPVHDPAWAAYDAGSDPHLRRWRRDHEQTRARPKSAHPPILIRQYGGSHAGNRARGLPPELGLRLQQAKADLEAERERAKQGLETANDVDLELDDDPSPPGAEVV